MRMRHLTARSLPPRLEPRQRQAAPEPAAGDVADLLPQPSPESWSGSLDTELISGKPGLGAAVDADHVEPAFVSATEPEEPEVEPLAVNLIDFPRELVAARKVRPRLAEGPLRDSSQLTGHDQLRIFEVAPESISQAVRVGPAGAEWSPIRLDTDPTSGHSGDGESSNHEIPLKPASFEDRLMAGIFDLALIVAAFALFRCWSLWPVRHIRPPANRRCSPPVWCSEGSSSYTNTCSSSTPRALLACVTPRLRCAPLMTRTQPGKPCAGGCFSCYCRQRRWGWDLSGRGSIPIAWGGMTVFPGSTSAVIPNPERNSRSLDSAFAPVGMTIFC